MASKLNITASIVIHNEIEEELKKTINSFLHTTITKKLYLIDNSPTDILKQTSQHPDVEYIFVGKNIGFAAGHNLIIDKIKNCSKYHLILNPDIQFNQTILPELISSIEKRNDVALIAPKVEYPNGVLQESQRKYPKFFELIFRFLKPSNNKLRANQLTNNIKSKNIYPDFLHGCFMLFKTDVFVKLNGFDERYFLYMEDVDICKKIDQLGMKKMYYPTVKITHILKRGSSKNIKLFFIHLSSIFKYYQKWGWKF